MANVLRGALVALVATQALAECPNACSGNGDCGNYDMCSCYRNWQGADCSLRTCPFGLAHVDTPKGDLDSSASPLSGPDVTMLLKSQTYPFGTQEQFPNMTDSAGNKLENTAHYYMECSNKGICDRMAGVCECFDGYEGSSCQRAVCPNDCSGHGTCEHIKTLAKISGDNEYRLWDATVTMGCSCDAGFTSPDCSLRECKVGIDPLYVDDEATVRVEHVAYRIGVNASVHGSLVLEGEYAIKFFDAFGEDYVTEPLRVDATCVEVKAALEGLPDKVIPVGSVVCTGSRDSALDSDGVTLNLKYVEFDLAFRGNPGYLKQLEVNTHLDGARPTVFIRNSTQPAEYAGIAPIPATVTVFNTGVTGEATDYFAKQCRNVYAEVVAETAGSGILTMTTSTVLDFPELNSGYFLSLDATETRAIKGCLGDSDGVKDDNVEVFDWDYGSVVSFDAANHRMMSSHPHAVKLVEVDGADGDFSAGLYFLIWWEPVQRKFILANFPSADLAGKHFAVYATDGVVERVIVDRRHGFADLDDDNFFPGDYGIGEINSGDHDYEGDGVSVRKDVDPRITAYFTAGSNVLYTSFDASCETAPGNVEACLKRGDLLFVIDSNFLTSSFDPSFNNGAATPGTYGTPSLHESGNLYRVQRVFTEAPTATTWAKEDRFRIVLDKNIPFSGETTTSAFEHLWNNATMVPASVGVVGLFKFTPAHTNNYDYVQPCSNRGTCNDGHCACFKGYTNDNCDVQSALAFTSGSSGF